MLVLSRYKGEALVINRSIRVVVVQTTGDRVRLGIEAPRHVPIHRAEVQDAIEKEDRGMLIGENATHQLFVATSEGEMEPSIKGTELELLGQLIAQDVAHGWGIQEIETGTWTAGSTNVLEAALTA